MRRRVWHKMLRRWGRVRRGDRGWMVQGVSRKLAPGFRVQVFTRKEEVNVSCWSKENGEWGLSIEVSGRDLTVCLHRRLQGSHWSIVLTRIRSKKSHSSWEVNPGASASALSVSFLERKGESGARSGGGSRVTRASCSNAKNNCMLVCASTSVTW